VLGQWPTGVTLVTTLVEGQRYGVTASSFSSVSLDPPLVSVCLARTAFAHDLVRDVGSFGVTILGKDHADLGQRFARYEPGVDRFAEREWVTATTGSPLLADALGWLDCRVVHAYDGGDHTIFVGEVLAADTPRTTSPLLYHSRTWGQFADQLPEDVVLTVGEESDLIVDVARVADARAVLDAVSDVHARPRVLLRNAFQVAPAVLGEAVRDLVASAPGEVVLVDAGGATPVQVREGCREAVLAARPVPLAVRLSDAGGLGQANLLTALKSGISRLEMGDLPVGAITLLVDALGLNLQGART
jgi:flavin reductase (DIM6/NTAB) family NADH-FMN oxidoreductase RutF